MRLPFLTLAETSLSLMSIAVVVAVCLVSYSELIRAGDAHAAFFHTQFQTMKHNCKKSKVLPPNRADWLRS
jgi:hypothetical protein